MKRKQIAILFGIAVILNCEAKRGGFGGFSRGGGGSKSSWSRPSPSVPSYSAPSPSYKPSYGWSPSVPSGSSFSQPKPAAPSYGWSPSVSSGSSFSQPKPAAPSYGWSPSVSSGSSFNQPKPAAPSYGWNVPGTNTVSKPASTSFNQPQKPSAPIGPPPSYPGLGNQPVSSFNRPPAYSPSYSNPPAYSHPSAYSPSNSYKPSPNFARPSYSTGNGFYGNNYNQPNYGSAFGSHGLPGNTYISNNYYGNSRSGGGSGFLTNALFFGAGMGSGYMWGNRNSHRDQRRWDEEEERKWRATTKAPYFENKFPGSDVILPASSVVAAATAFGLTSLLPLNIPSNKPLMYCGSNTSEIAQVPIIINEYVYKCINETIFVTKINCLKPIGNYSIESPKLNETTTSETSLIDSEKSIIKIESDCNEESSIMKCESDANIYCTNGTVLSRIDIFCNSTTLLDGTVNLIDSSLALTCFDGFLPQKQTAFIPTTEAPITTTEKQSLSFAAKTHLFFLKLIGRGDAVKKPETTTPLNDIPQDSVDSSPSFWVPEPLTIPPETTTDALKYSTEKYIESSTDATVENSSLTTS